MVHKQNLTNTDIILGRTILDNRERERINTEKGQLSGLTDIHDVEIGPETFTLRRFSGIGAGRVYKIKDMEPLNIDSTFEGTILRHGEEDLKIQEALENPELCIPPKVENVKPRKIGKMPTEPRKNLADEESSNLMGAEKQGTPSNLHVCPRCQKAYLYKKALATHMSSQENCKLRTKPKSTIQLAKDKFIEKLNNGIFET